jgi:hypothetical protein
MRGFCERLALQLIVLFLAVIASGCAAQTRLTHTKRSAVEQLLFSTAADRAWQRADPSVFNGKKVYVDTNYFEGDDKLYALGTLRDVLSSNGALLMANAQEAEVIIEPRSGAFSIDSSDSIIGLPKIPIPIPAAGTLETPEVALFKSEKQFSTAKFAYLAFEQTSRKHVASSGPLVGRANIKYYKVLWLIKWTKTTIPEKQKNAEKAAAPPK